MRLRTPLIALVMTLPALVTTLLALGATSHASEPTCARVRFEARGPYRLIPDSAATRIAQLLQIPRPLRKTGLGTRRAVTGVCSANRRFAVLDATRLVGRSFAGEGILSLVDSCGSVRWSQSVGSSDLLRVSDFGITARLWVDGSGLPGEDRVHLVLTDSTGKSAGEFDWDALGFRKRNGCEPPPFRACDFLPGSDCLIALSVRGPADRPDDQVAHITAFTPGAGIAWDTTVPSSLLGYLSIFPLQRTIIAYGTGHHSSEEGTCVASGVAFLDYSGEVRRIERDVPGLVAGVQVVLRERGFEAWTAGLPGIESRIALLDWVKP